MDGYNVCIFAYGQTGSGKTFTIYGNKAEPGLTPRGVKELFKILERDSGKFTFSVKLYMLELYQDSLQDLLAPQQPKNGPATREKGLEGAFAGGWWGHEVVGCVFLWNFCSRFVLLDWLLVFVLLLFWLVGAAS